MARPNRTYTGLFLLAFSTLAVEITLTRLLSVVTWYHLAFFAVSSAMLGMTAGAVTVYLRPVWSQEQRLALACMAYAVSLPLSTVALCLIPLELARSVMSLIALLMATGACALPFYWSGIVTTAVLTRSPLPIGRLYAADLVGASLGCLFVLGGLEVLDAPSLLFVCGSVGALAALAFSAKGSRLVLLARRLSLALAILSLLNASTSYGVRPFLQKGKVQGAGSYLVERWNSFSRVTVAQRAHVPPQYWGPSPRAPQEPVEHHVIAIDSDAGTAMRRFSTRSDIEHLRYDVTNVAYHLRPDGGACVIGVGGGRDIQAALLFGHKRVVGIEVNPIFVDLLTQDFAEFAGLAGRPEVTLVVDEARSRLTRDTGEYALIQMSLVDTWAATGAGAFALSENALYTVEAWQVFLRRLRPDGVFTVSRWYSAGSLGETGRLLSLAVASLLASGATHPADHIALVSSGNVGTLIIGKAALRSADVALLMRTSEELGYKVPILPNAPPEDPTLAAILAARSPSELAAATSGKTLDYEPTTDERPYFFNMLRLRSVFALPAQMWLVRGNLVATATLLGLVASLLLFTVATVLVPLFAGSRRRNDDPPTRLPAAAYFSLIGAGFMFLEIGLLQRFTVFLGHPEYALGVILFTIISSAGIGSLLSERLPLRVWLVAAGAAGISALLLIVGRWLPLVLSQHLTFGAAARIAVAVGVLFPLGIWLGIFFPIGMRFVETVRGSASPWYWALNGSFGVLSSAFAVVVSVYVGISFSFYTAALCYALLVPCAVAMAKARKGRHEGQTVSPQ